VTLTYAWLFIVGAVLWGMTPNIQSLLFLSGSLAPAAAGLVWWSELPRTEDGAEPDIFD
jgi:hypothetical protein